MPIIVNNTTFPSLLDLIAPYSCLGCGRIGNALCDRCKKYIKNHYSNICPFCKNLSQNGICKSCRHNHINLPPIYSIGERSNLLNQIIHDYKYNSIYSIAKPLAELITYRLPEPSNNTFIVPLPTINSHIRSRGFDHILLIAKQLTRLNHYYKIKKALVRLNNTIQVGSTRSNRLIQAKNAYEINPKTSINPSDNYILLDDVWTTGASLLSATKILQQAGVSNISIAVLSISK